MTNPIILLADNDAGAKPVFEAVKQATDIKPTGKEAHVHVGANMYLVPIPTAESKSESMIEDLFDPSLLAAKVDGKSFHAASKGFNKSIHYGKTVFAHKVVRANADSIDFSGFSSLLSNISDVIAVHAKKAESS